jgi:hypothetical protein
VRVGLSIALAAASCGDDRVEIDRCPGTEPELSSCFVGDFFAECGGDGPPRLACAEDECRWFAGGCVATGYEASDCDATDVCCHSAWPFANPDHNDLFPRLFGFGLHPWDRTTETRLSASVDPGLAIPMSSVSCSGPPPFYPEFGFDPCTEEQYYSVRIRSTVTIGSTPLYPQIAGWTPWVEIIRDDVGGMTARMCAVEFTDAHFLMCGDWASLCAASGSVTMSHWPFGPDDRPGLRVDATFESGFRFQADVDLGAQ